MTRRLLAAASPAFRIRVMAGPAAAESTLPSPTIGRCWRNIAIPISALSSTSPRWRSSLPPTSPVILPKVRLKVASATSSAPNRLSVSFFTLAKKPRWFDTRGFFICGTGPRPNPARRDNGISACGADRVRRRFALSAKLDMQDLRRHTEPRRDDAGAEPAGDDQMPLLLDDVAVGVTRAVA